MAFTSAVTYKDVWGTRRAHYGTYTSADGSTGGDVNTGLKRCEAFFMQAVGSSAIANAPALNETLPVDGSAITIVTAANETGHWIAFGV